MNLNKTFTDSLTSRDFAPAQVSFTIAAIPEEPIYSEIAKASLKISELCRNQNIIDNEKWPCHLSLIISGTDLAGMETLSQLLGDSRARKPVKATATSIYTGRGGFIGVPLDGEGVIDLHRNVAEIVAQVLKGKKLLRPHLQSRWPYLSSTERGIVSVYGSFKIGKQFHPHLSVAQVGDLKAQTMLKIAKEVIRIPQEVLFRELQLVDVGHNNEKWDIFSRVPITI